MRSAMAVVQANAKVKQIQKEKDRIMNAFASFPESKHRATTKVVRQVLLNGPYLLRGKLWEVKSKSLGAGIYELSLESKDE